MYIYIMISIHYERHSEKIVLFVPMRKTVYFHGSRGALRNIRVERQRLKGGFFLSVGYNSKDYEQRRMIMEDRERKVTAAALLIVAGGIVGAGLALLLAPQSGRRTRRDISRYARRVRAKADESVADLAANIDDFVETIGDKTDELVGKGKDVAGSARKDLIRLIEEGASRLEKFRTRLSRM